MTNATILKKAIEKAVENGLRGYSVPATIEYMSLMIEDGDYYSCIFSHDFAKAFFGKDYICMECLKPIDECIEKESYLHIGFADRCLAWVYHLRRMVLHENPLQYLAQFLEGEG